MEQCFLHEGITPPRVMGLSSHETLKQAVMAGMGLAFLSLDTLGLELKERLLTTLDVIGLPLQRRWCVVRSASEPLTAAAGSLLHYVVDHGGDSTSVTHDAVPALVPLPAS